MSDGTIAAVSTAKGRGGVAIVRISGSEALAIAERLTNRRPAADTITRTQVFDADGRLIDRAVVLTFIAPRSYTGEDVVEIQCHGGSVTPRRVLEAALSAGARLACRGEFTRRAFLNGRITYEEAEATLALIEAKTARAADAALEGLAGAQRHEMEALYRRLLALSSALEHALDVDDGDLDDQFFVRRTEELREIKNDIARALARAREGRILRDGALVVLAGAPNAGKSSLMNALLGENRVIVSATPGTTRDSVEEWLDVAGWPVRLVDTAGMRESGDGIEAEGIRRAEELVKAADVVLALDCDLPRAIRVHAKCDLGAGEGLAVSSVTGEGLDNLRQAIAERLEALSASNGDDAGDGDFMVQALLAAKADLAQVDGIVREDDMVVSANAVRQASAHLGCALGATYSEDLLDQLFARFCVGK